MRFGKKQKGPDAMQKQRARKWLSIGLLAIALSACKTGASSIPLVEYPKEFQQAAARELPKAGPHIQIMINDYGKTRDAIRSQK